MRSIHSSSQIVHNEAKLKAGIAEAEEILANWNWSQEMMDRACIFVARVTEGFECSPPEEIAGSEPQSLRDWVEAWVEYAGTELRRMDVEDAPPPPPPAYVDFPSPEITSKPIVVATVQQLARAAGDVEPRRYSRRRMIPVADHRVEREPISRRLMARRAKPEASRAPPRGDNDDEPDEPDPDKGGAKLRAFFARTRSPRAGQ